METERHKRSILKAILYRCLGITVLFTVTWLLTKSIPETTVITVSYHVISVCGYYAHERVWNRIRWGKE